MATTLAGFVAALQALSLTGVKQFLPGPPAQLRGGDLPVCWINSVSISEAPAARGGINWPTLTAELYVPVSPVAQDTRSANFERAVEMADTVKAALRAATLAIGQATVRAAVSIITVATVDYWGVTATVEAAG